MYFISQAHFYTIYLPTPFDKWLQKHIYQDKLAYQRPTVPVNIEKCLKKKNWKHVKHSRRKIGQGAAFMGNIIWDYTKREWSIKKYNIKDLWKTHKFDTERILTDIDLPGIL